MKTLITILKKPMYALLGFFVFLFSFIVFSITPHLTELGGVINLDRTLEGGGQIIKQTLLSLVKHNTEPTLVPTLLIAILTGLTTTLLVYYYKMQGGILLKTSGTGVFGLILGVLGIVLSMWNTCSNGSFRDCGAWWSCSITTI